MKGCLTLLLCSLFCRPGLEKQVLNVSITLPQEESNVHISAAQNLNWRRQGDDLFGPQPEPHPPTRARWPVCREHSQCRARLSACRASAKGKRRMSTPELPTWGVSHIYQEPPEANEGSGAETATQIRPKRQWKWLPNGCRPWHFISFAKLSHIRGT